MRRSLLALTFLALTAGACGGGEDSTDVITSTVGQPTTTESPTTTSSTVSSSTMAPTSGIDEVGDEQAQAIAAVVSAIDRKNRFELDGWLDAFDGGERQGVPLFAEQILMNAGQQWEIAEPCQVEGISTVGDTIVDCLIVNTDAFWGVGNIYEPRTLTFRVNDDGKLTTQEGVTNATSFRSQQRQSFNRSFHQWLSDTYPDVYNEMGYESISSSGPGFATKNPDHMLIAVDYVEEFVAQSDDYPLNP